MALSVHTEITAHLTKTFGASAFATSGNTATMTSANITHAQLSQLHDVCVALGHYLSVVSGVITIKPH